MMQNRVREAAAKKLLFLPHAIRHGTKPGASGERKHNEVLSLPSRVTPWDRNLYR
jgi:hypothetical protein